MNEKDPRNEDELSQKLNAWRAPDTPPDLDARVLSSFRRGQWSRRSAWRLLLKGSVRVPLPVAIAAGLLCVFSTLAALRPHRVEPTLPEATVIAPARPESERRPADDVAEKDLVGFEPTNDIRVTILYPGDAR